MANILRILFFFRSIFLNIIFIFYLQGLDTIHNSFLTVHGHLTSKNCLVDDRWVVKIGDFGLKELRSKEMRNKEGSEFFKMQKETFTLKRHSS